MPLRIGSLKNAGVILTFEGSISEISTNQSNLLEGFTMAWIKKKVVICACK